MESFKVLLLFSYVCLGYASTSSGFIRSWHDCSDAKILEMVITGFGVSPEPFHIPGNLTFTLIGDVPHRLPANSQYRLNVALDKKLLGQYHPFPCSHQIGTCQYENPCEFIQTLARTNICPEGINFCTCPFSPLSLNVQPFPIEFQAMPASVEFLFEGDFKARVEVLNGATMIGCIALEFSLHQPCTGFLCGHSTGSQ